MRERLFIPLLVNECEAEPFVRRCHLRSVASAVARFKQFTELCIRGLIIACLIMRVRENVQRLQNLPTIAALPVEFESLLRPLDRLGCAARACVETPEREQSARLASPPLAAPRDVERLLEVLLRVGVHALREETVAEVYQASRNEVLHVVRLRETQSVRRELLRGGHVALEEPDGTHAEQREHLLRPVLCCARLFNGKF